MGFEVTHVNQFVLTNANEKFSALRTGPKDKRGRYDHKKGDNFTEQKDPDGKTKSISYDAAQASDDDGDGQVGTGTHRPGTSATWTDGTPINGSQYPYVVLPQNQINGLFKDMQLGDYVKVTNPATGQSYMGIYADRGPDDEVGEVSKFLGDKVGANGDPWMTDASKLHYDLYPGSGLRKNGHVVKQTPEEIQKNGQRAADAASVAGGYIIKRNGPNSILVGQKMQPVVCADPWSFHVGDCPIKTGSATVSGYGYPLSRVGDDCTCGKQVVSGDNTVWAFGPATTTFLPPAKLPDGWKSPNLTPGWDSNQTIPSWAQPSMGPTSSLPSMQSVGDAHFPAQ
jgi:uncharacterized Zn-binding protein involved in type VI secretion